MTIVIQFDFNKYKYVLTCWYMCKHLKLELVCCLYILFLKIVNLVAKVTMRYLGTLFEKN